MDHPLSGRRAVVTGASGFIGRHLCRALMSIGVETHGVTRTQRAQRSEEPRWWTSDWCDPQQPVELLSQLRPDLVFHFAGHVSGERDAKNVLPMLRSNVGATVNLLLAARELGIRVVLAGSMEEPIEQPRQSAPSSPYAASKAAASGYARLFAELYGVEVAILRIFMVYGPGLQEGRRLVPYVIQSLLRGRAPQLTPGTRQMDWIFVEDVVNAALATATAVGIKGKTLDVGTGRMTTAREIASLITEIIGTSIQPEYGIVAPRPRETEYTANPAATERLIGWRPQVDLEEGLRRTVDWHRRHTDGLQLPASSLNSTTGATS
ncbi:MAG: NAD-dependent epimerase/dehydratase family protein [Pirellulales bacterium]